MNLIKEKFSRVLHIGTVAAAILFAFSFSARGKDFGIDLGGSPGEDWHAYLTQKEEIDQLIASGPVDQELLQLAVGVAIAAVATEDIDALDHIDAAFAVIDRIPGDNTFLMTLAQSAPRILMFPLLDHGFIEVAAEVNKRVEKLTKPANPIMGVAMAKVTEGMLDDMSAGMLATFINDYETEEKVLVRAIERSGKILTETPTEGARKFMHISGKQGQQLSLALLLAKQGKMDQATATFQRAMDIEMPEITDDSVRTLPLKRFRDHQRTLLMNNSIMSGNVCYLLGRYAEAEMLLNSAADEVEKYVYHPSHPSNTKAVFDTLKGQVLFELGRSDEAMAGWNRALEIVRATRGVNGAPLPDHSPYVTAIHEGRAWALLQTGSTEAQDAALHLHETRMEMLRRLFNFASEKQRLAYHQSADPFSLLIAIDDIETLTHAVLNLKGAVLDSVLEDRRIAGQVHSPELVKLMRKLRFARLLALRAEWESADRLDAKQERVKLLEAELAKLQPEGGHRKTALATSLDQVRNALHPQDRLCEFVRYEKLRDGGGREPYYGALILSKEGNPQWKALAPAGEVDPLIFELKKAMSGAVVEDDLLEKILRRLYSHLIAPIEEQVFDGGRLILSPDGPLSCLSFAVLMDGEGKFLSERCDLYYVATARDMIKPTTPPNAEVAVTIFSNPAFAADGIVGPSIGKFQKVGVPFSIPDVALPPLPGTEQEMKAIVSIATEVGWSHSTFSDAEASERSLKEVSISADVLHFATHGLFLEKGASIAAVENQTLAMGQEGGLSDDPLVRAMLTLAGADRTFLSWRNGARPDPMNDGILTAAEIAATDLSNTWLAVLSACDTAAGENFDGEGVMGLRRGFFLAGVDHLIMTFWPIADEETVAIMTDFYRDLTESRHPGVSIGKVQREALVNFKENRSLFETVFLAGPFAASISGPLPAGGG